IIAFNAIKTRQTSFPPSIAGKDKSSTHAVTAPKEMARHDEAKLTRSPGKPGAKEDRKAERGKPVESAAPIEKVYVVAKGDNPVTIAKKLKVSYDELLAINHIDDPRKLQVGQKLLIPAKIPKGKRVTNEERGRDNFAVFSQCTVRAHIFCLSPFLACS